MNGSKLSRAWIVSCAALAVHVIDNAATDFVGYYNSTVLALYGHFSWFPRLDIEFRTWIIGAVVVLVVLFALTALLKRYVALFKWLAYLFAVYLFLDGCGHVAAALLGHTVPSVHFSGLPPGFYSSPLLIATSVYLLLTAMKTKTSGHARSGHG